MNAFHTDIQQQPEALRQLADFYTRSIDLLQKLKPPARVLLSGMGASFHGALWASYVLQARGIWAVAIEASDIIHYSASLLNGVDQVVYISQSGASGEVLPFISKLPASVELLALTNDPTSPLASHAHHVLPLIAGTELSVATKTYLNSLACLWLLAEQWHTGQTHCAVFLRLADIVEQQLSSNPLAPLQSAQRLFFLGHGPHITTARQSAMMLGEWAKYPSIGTSIGAFRHGLIEIVDDQTGIVLFGSGGATHESTQALAHELRSYGAQVISVVEGQPDKPMRDFDEMLSPLLDVIPTQIFAEGMARHLGIAPGFRHISKVVQRL